MATKGLPKSEKTFLNMGGVKKALGGKVVKVHVHGSKYNARVQ
jgi:hypothetical protein